MVVVVGSTTELAAASRDGHLALRRVERQQALVERLYAASGRWVTIAELARALRVSHRTAARDVERLQQSGVPIRTRRGAGGGVDLGPVGPPTPITFDLPELAALVSSLAVLGPTVSPSADSAMRKLVAALAPEASR